MRWTSRENLLTAATDEDPQLFVSLYDFQAGGENHFFKDLTDFHPQLESHREKQKVEDLHLFGLLKVFNVKSNANLSLNIDLNE